MAGRFETFRAMAVARATVRTVSGAFEDFLDREINIARGIRRQASSSQNHLREFLVGENDRDEFFPRVLQSVDQDFLGGSFARHSKIWPLDDIDIYFPIDGVNLVYSRGGGRAPYTVMTDGVLDSNPLLDDPDRWMDGVHISSRKLIDGFAKVLRRHYTAKTRVRKGGEAVIIEMSELGFDVVPCFALNPDYGVGHRVYVIPDGKGGWIETNPRIDNDVSDDLQAQNNKMFRRAVKLVKWWNEHRFGKRFDSYYVELAIMRGFQAKNQWGAYTSIVSDAVALGFESLRDAASAGNLTSWLPSSPAVERGDMSVNQWQHLDTIATAARDAVNSELAGDSEYAMKVWRVIFGDSFAPEE